MPNVLITSTNRGLGLEFAKQYAAAGYQVFAACRHPAAAFELRQLAGTSQGRLSIVAMDVTDLASVDGAVAALQGQSVDVLLNTAGIAGPPAQTWGGIDYASWAQVFDVNTMGPARVTTAFEDAIARGDRKLVVTISSGMEHAW